MDTTLLVGMKLLTGLLVLLLFSLLLVTPIPSSAAPALKVATTPLPPPAVDYAYTAKVVKVVDGDTIDVVIDLGFSLFSHQRLRLLGVYASEDDTPAGKAQHENLTLFFSGHSDVVVRTHRKDKYGRYLADVWVDGNHVNASQQLYIGEPQGKGVK